MKKKYIFVIIVFCFAILLVILGISKLGKKDDVNDSGEKKETSIMVDDTTKEVIDDESNSSENNNSEIDTWIESMGNSTTDKVMREGEVSEEDNKVTSDTTSDYSGKNENKEDEKSKDEKPEWIEGDF